MSDEQYNLSLFEVCENLSRSKRTISRYVRHSLLHPIKVKSRLGTLEYRFSQDDLKNFKAIHQTRQDETGQDRQDGTRQDKTGQDMSADNKDRTEDVLNESKKIKDLNPDEDESVDETESVAVYEEIPDSVEDYAEETEPVIRQDNTEQDVLSGCEDKTRQDRTQIAGEHKGNYKGDFFNKKIIGILEKELDQKNKQLAEKDEQIKNLSERVKEDNYLMAGFRSELKLLQQGKEKKEKKSKSSKENIPEYVLKKKQAKKRKPAGKKKKSWWQF